MNSLIVFRILSHVANVLSHVANLFLSHFSLFRILSHVANVLSHVANLFLSSAFSLTWLTWHAANVQETRQWRTSCRRHDPSPKRRKQTERFRRKQPMRAQQEILMPAKVHSSSTARETNARVIIRLRWRYMAQRSRELTLRYAFFLKTCLFNQKP